MLQSALKIGKAKMKMMEQMKSSLMHIWYSAAKVWLETISVWRMQ